MTWMTGPDCAVICNLINTHTHTIGEGRREVKKRKKMHKSYRRGVGNGRDLGGKRKKRRQERFRSVAADSDNLRIARKQEGKHEVLRA